MFSLAEDRDRAAKIYHDPAHVDAQKLRLMVSLANAELLTMTAWPELTVHGGPDRRLIGFVMPRARGESLSDLLGPGSRKELFPRATFEFVVLAAKNLATAFAAVHSAGAVVGDVKEMNAFVDEDALVTLLDTDGFQLATGSKVFHTRAVTSSHQPPELQGLSDAASVRRIPEHDAFGLAVLIFQLLFMGRHPFSGKPTTGRDLEIHQAIKDFQFAWAPQLTIRLYDRPPKTLDLSDVGPLGDLFIRAFLAGKPETRPSAKDWASALDVYGRALKGCRGNPAHAYFGSECPLCRVEGETGTLLFIGPAGGPSALDVQQAWARIVAVLSPGPAPELPRLTPATPRPPPRGLLARLFASRARSAELQRARQRLEVLTQQWAACGAEAFESRLQTLRDARDRLRALEAEKAQRVHAARLNMRQSQFDHFLRSHSIARAKLDGIEAKQINILRSFRLETAFDIDEFALGWVTLFGPRRLETLRTWRTAIEREFKFDHTKGVHPLDLEAIEREFAPRRVADEETLRRGPAELSRLTEDVRTRRAELMPKIQAAQQDLAQTLANAAGVQ